MNNNTTTTKIIPPRGDQHTHTIIFLHGRDSNADEFANELFESEVSPPAAQGDNNTTTPSSPPPPTALIPIRNALPAGIRWVFPQAPSLPSARFGGVELTQWFDMHSTQDPHQLCGEQQQLVGLRESVRRVRDCVEAEERLVPRERVFLCGISQGLAVVLAALLADGRGGFAGLVGLCGWMPLRSLVMGEGEESLSVGGGGGGLAEVCVRMAAELFADGQAGDAVDLAALRAVPIHLQHNRDDGVVPVMHGVKLVTALREYLGFDVEWKEYPDGGHWLQEPDGADAF
ncbi:uncharacterized protein PgNI_01156 [Pyricularia grisea]|uniref:Phospholipase/carboxylesterase/thioesterase domain-containing protein n=1 Tax=Pyricularia grisea TaxID=148305 RepID=A0A6P8BJ04_PYRGI|nr:uncharacterized protein PgNI_01156 [Pyricularia grisea]TLD16629.1 hypothetical protein PgNI_01156 [Pyricularia grisea]